MGSPRWHKDLYAAIQSRDLTAFPKIASSSPAARPTCVFLDAFLSALPNQDMRRARELLEMLWAEHYDPATDRFLTTYVPGTQMLIGIADEIDVTLTPDRDSLGLMLAEVRQACGDRAGAIDLVEQLTPTTPAAVSLAELYAEQRQWDQVVELTETVANDDDCCTYLLIARGAALRELGQYASSRSALRSALGVRSRPAELRHLALLERARTYLAEGKRSLARKDCERVLAEDPDYPGLRAFLDQLDPSDPVA